MNSILLNEKMKIIDKGEVEHKSSRKKKIPFSKYEKAINGTDIVEWIKSEIAKSENGRIRVRIIDLVKELDIDIQNRTYTAIYTALDYVFFKRGILVNLSTANNGDKLLVFRLKKDIDKTPYWIEKLLNKEIDVEKLEEDKSIIKREIQSLKVIADDEVSIEESNNKEIDNKEEVNKVCEEKTIVRNRFRKFRKQKFPEEYVKNEIYENPYKVDIFEFDYDKLGWRVKQSKTIYTNLQLLEFLKQGISKPGDRHRIEITAIKKNINNKVEKKEDREKENLEEKKEDREKEKENLEEKKEDREKENKQPQEVEDKLGQLLPQKEDGEKNAAIQYLIQRYKRSYPNEKK